MMNRDVTGLDFIPQLLSWLINYHEELKWQSSENKRFEWHNVEKKIQGVN